MYYNYPKMVKDLYAIMDASESKFHPTIRIMLDECVGHFLQEHKVPFEKQAEFLSVMFEDCQRVLNDYKNKKFY